MTRSVAGPGAEPINWGQRMTVIDRAHTDLCESRDDLKVYGARKAAAAIQRAIKSLDGAYRHADRMARKTRDAAPSSPSATQATR